MLPEKKGLQAEPVIRISFQKFKLKNQGLKKVPDNVPVKLKVFFINSSLQNCWPFNLPPYFAKKIQFF